MQAVSNVYLEEFNRKHKKAFHQYTYDFDINNKVNMLSGLFLSYGYFEYDDIINWYKQQKDSSIGEECQNLNAILKTERQIKPNFNFNYDLLELPVRIYFLKHLLNNKIIGSLFIQCSYDDLTKQYVPEISFEINPTERNKGYGSLLLQLFQRKNNLDVDYFRLRIHSSNKASLRLVSHFNPYILAALKDYEGKLLYLEIENKVHRKTMKNVSSI